MRRVVKAVVRSKFARLANVVNCAFKSRRNTCPHGFDHVTSIGLWCFLRRFFFVFFFSFYLLPRYVCLLLRHVFCLLVSAFYTNVVLPFVTNRHSVFYSRSFNTLIFQDFLYFNAQPILLPSLLSSSRQLCECFLLAKTGFSAGA